MSAVQPLVQGQGDEKSPSPVAVAVAVAEPIAVPVSASAAMVQPVAAPVPFGGPVSHGSATRSRAHERAEDADCFDSKIDIGRYPARDGDWSSGPLDCCADPQSAAFGCCYPPLQFAFTNSVAFGSDTPQADDSGCDCDSNVMDATNFYCKFGGFTAFAYTLLIVWLYVMGNALRDSATSAGVLVTLGVLVVVLLVAYVQRSVYGTQQRTRLRAKYGIRGTSAMDCCMQFFCEPFAICQEAREVKIRLQSATVSGALVP